MRRILSFSTAMSVALLAVLFISLCSASNDVSDSNDTPTPSIVGTQPEEFTNLPDDGSGTADLPSNNQHQTRFSSFTSSNPFSFLSCASYLRPLYPHYFTHCTCRYSAFSDWEISTYRRVPTYQCSSGLVVVETRTRRVIEGSCQNDVEERTSVCKCSRIMAS